MTISTEQFISVNTGISSNDGTGDSLRAAFIKVNDNFDNMSTIGFDAGNIRVSGALEATGNISTTGNIVASGVISGGYVALTAGATAMVFRSDNVIRVTPNATATYTTTVPPAGTICVLSILTSGSVSYTITFGTGFKSTGTLATGVTSARYFQITFVSDGVNLLEMSRTTAIA